MQSTAPSEAFNATAKDWFTRSQRVLDEACTLQQILRFARTERALRNFCEVSEAEVRFVVR